LVQCTRSREALLQIEENYSSEIEEGTMEKKHVDEHLVDNVFCCYKCNENFNLEKSEWIDLFRKSDGELLVRVQCPHCAVLQWFRMD
jgi:hypothetical protein